MDFFLANWLTLLVVAAIGFIAGRVTAKSPLERDRERRDQAAALRQHKARLTHETKEAVQELLRNGKTIEAIKRVREDLNIGLKEAKDLVDELRAGQR